MEEQLVVQELDELSLVDEVEHGRAMAIFSHCSVLFGLPVFMAPLVLRNNRFALHHAKAAAINYLLFFVIVLSSAFIWEWLIVLTLLSYVPALVGVIQSANGQLAGRLGFGGTGEKIFHQLEVK